MTLATPALAAPAQMNPCQGQTDSSHPAYVDELCEVDGTPACFYDPVTNSVDCNLADLPCDGVDAYAVSNFTSNKTYVTVYGTCEVGGDPAFCCAQRVDGSPTRYVDSVRLEGTKELDNLAFHHSDPDIGYTRELSDTSGSTGKVDASLHGGGGADTLTGSPYVGVDYEEALNGDGGGDTIYGQSGDDTIRGGDGEDTLHGGDGVDHIYGDGATDYIYGDDGNDILRGGDAQDFIYGYAGDDTIYGNAGRDRIFGGDNDDTLFGNRDSDHIYGQNDNDTIYGNDNDGGTEKLYGGSGDDIIKGGAGNDELYGDADDDKLWGMWGDDDLDGGAGVDQLYGGEDDDTLIGGTEGDFLCEDDFGLNAANNFLTGGAGSDKLVYRTSAASPSQPGGLEDVEAIYSAGNVASLFDFVNFNTQLTDNSASANTALPECNEMF